MDWEDNATENLVFEENATYQRADFESLECWKSARLLRIMVSEFVKKMPEDEKYRLADQLLRASRSVCDNIAEGYGRYHYKDTIRFCLMARGSLAETKNHLITALDEQFLSVSEFDSFIQQQKDVSKLLNGYIRYLHSLFQNTQKNQ